MMQILKVRNKKFSASNIYQVIFIYFQSEIVHQQIVTTPEIKHPRSKQQKYYKLNNNRILLIIIYAFP